MYSISTSNFVQAGFKLRFTGLNFHNFIKFRLKSVKIKSICNKAKAFEFNLFRQPEITLEEAKNMAQQAKSYDFPNFKEQYENFIGGGLVAPKRGSVI